MRLRPATVLILAAFGAAVGCGDREPGAPAALPPSGTAYRKLNDRDRLAVAAGCRDRAAARADGTAAAELARVDARALRDELDATFSLIGNQPRPVAAICERRLPFVTPGLTLRFDGAKDGGVEFTYETDSDKPLTISGTVSPSRPGAVTMRRAYESAKAKSYTAQIAEDGHFVLPTQRLRKIANNTFTLSFDVPPSAPRKAYFTAICLDCLAGGPPPANAGR
jgi:hypothetical protein